MATKQTERIVVWVDGPLKLRIANAAGKDVMMVSSWVKRLIVAELTRRDELIKPVTRKAGKPQKELTLTQQLERDVVYYQQNPDAKHKPE